MRAGTDKQLSPIPLTDQQLFDSHNLSTAWESVQDSGAVWPLGVVPTLTDKQLSVGTTPEPVRTAGIIFEKQSDNNLAYITLKYLGILPT